jgi:hypothetical protein
MVAAAKPVSKPKILPKVRGPVQGPVQKIAPVAAQGALPPGVNPAVARQQLANANMARTADIQSHLAGRPDMAGDYSNTMARVPASVQNLTGSKAVLPTPRNIPLPAPTKRPMSTGQFNPFAGKGASPYSGYGNFGGSSPAGQRSSGQSFGNFGSGFGNIFNRGGQSSGR